MPPDIYVAVEHRAKHTVRILERLNAIGGGGDFCVHAHCSLDLFTATADVIKSLLVDVHKCYFRIDKCRKSKEVAHDGSGKCNASCTDKCKLFHMVESILPVFQNFGF